MLWCANPRFFICSNDTTGDGSSDSQQPERRRGQLITHWRRQSLTTRWARKQRRQHTGRRSVKPWPSLCMCVLGWEGGVIHRRMHEGIGVARRESRLWVRVSVTRRGWVHVTRRPAGPQRRVARPRRVPTVARIRVCVRVLWRIRGDGGRVRAGGHGGRRHRMTPAHCRWRHGDGRSGRRRRPYSKLYSRR